MTPVNQSARNDLSLLGGMSSLSDPGPNPCECMFGFGTSAGPPFQTKEGQQVIKHVLGTVQSIKGMQWVVCPSRKKTHLSALLSVRDKYADTFVAERSACVMDGWQVQREFSFIVIEGDVSSYVRNTRKILEKQTTVYVVGIRLRWNYGYK